MPDTFLPKPAIARCFDAAGGALAFGPCPVGKIGVVINHGSWLERELDGGMPAETGVPTVREIAA